MRKFALFILAVATLNLGCSSQDKGGVIENVDVKKFKELVDSGKGIILDVRTPDEVSRGYIEGASAIDISGDGFESKVDVMQKDKPIYVYCLSGGRSAKAAKILEKKGFKKVYNLDGGMMAWNKANYPVITGKTAAVSTGEQYDEASFTKLITSESVVLIDFHAVWCAPCKKMQPTIDKLTINYNGKAGIHKVDIDQNKELVKKYDVIAVPTFALFKDGKKVWQQSGEQTYEQLVTEIEKYL